MDCYYKYIREQFKPGKLVEGKYRQGTLIKIESVNFGRERTDIVYRFYNRNLECGGYKVSAFFVGDRKDIMDNIQLLIFDGVYLNKRKMEGIKIYFTTQAATKKHSFDNVIGRYSK